ncbi:MAG: DUF4252 domain-containing protein [Saprospiraceae bacterium]|nr:DUF4252 domain-containing protein [Saprospiraceae bacterium]MCB0574305.1 DUF4252 domain-containing protein [Saprospiraceae bacterium]MCB9307538.1 DUF4252 domain-containing protein [Lewinellaceae bacterium]MCB9356500.1 DUF4252 domain-containing protein [Lewinellaceae bacterium]
MLKSIFAGFCLLICAGPVGAQDYGLYWKYKDYDGIAVTVPSVAIDIASWFVGEKEERVLMRRVNKVRVLVFEDGNNPVTERDMERFERKAKRRHLEDILFVRDGKTRVRVLARERGNAIRKIVVLVHTPEEFVMVSVRGKLRWKDINRAFEKYGRKHKGKEKPLLPPSLKVPVSRV